MSNYLGFMPTTKENFYFVSYNNEDADRLSATACLLKDSGIPLWYDYGLEYGKEWEQQISSRIADAKAILLLFTKGILYKEQSFVEREYKIAKAFDKKVIVLFAEEITKKDVPASSMSWWIDITDKQCINIWQMNDQKQIVSEVYRALQLDPEMGKYNKIAYPCPYCGVMIVAKDVLFVQEDKTMHTDLKFGMFLRWHGVRSKTGNKFGRVFYKVMPGINVIREDENGFPLMIEDSPNHAYGPEALDRENDTVDETKDPSIDSSWKSSEKNERQPLLKIPLRACPHCHCQLPLEFGIFDMHHVLMMGCRSAGKTAYLINLFQQLNTQLSENHLGSASWEKESYDYLNSITREYERVDATPVNVEYRGMIPVVCRFQNPNKKAFIVFNDIPGEGTMDPSFVSHRGIADSEILLLLIDPLALGKRQSHEGTNDTGFSDNLSLKSFLDSAGDICNAYAHKIKNVICVITKLDILIGNEEGLLDAETPEFLNDIGSTHKEEVDLQTLNRMDQDLSEYISKTYGIDLKREIISALGKDLPIRILGVSTHTRKEDKEGKILFDSNPSGQSHKHRIIEPFLAIAADLGLMPVKDGKLMTNEMTTKPEKPHGLFGLFRRKA